MKQIIQNIQTGILLFLSLIAVQSLYAQVPAISYTLNTTETVTKNYTARDEVKMLPGFRFSAVGGNTFKANIDAGLLFPPTENTYALPNGQITNDPTQGSVVGSIPGQFSVSEAGSATYTIPIEVPAGINGMQPAIAIGYNSNAGYGTLGTGWNLTGISAITRGGKSIYFDSSTESIKFNNTDALYLDGQRLILLSGTHFSPDAIYATEVEDYSRVKIHLNTDGSIYFVLTTIEGKIIEFGKTVDSKLTNYFTGDHSVLSWKINSAIDTYNNSINYSYTHTPGDTIPEHSEWQWDGQDDIEIIIPEEIIPASNTGQYLKQIDYAGQSVVFNYNINNTYAHNFIISNFKISQSELLQSITTKVGSTIINNYQFVYNNNDKLTIVR